MTPFHPWVRPSPRRRRRGCRRPRSWRGRRRRRRAPENCITNERLRDSAIDLCVTARLERGLGGDGGEHGLRLVVQRAGLLPHRRVGEDLGEPDNYKLT